MKEREKNEGGRISTKLIGEEKEIDVTGEVNRKRPPRKESGESTIVMKTPENNTKRNLEESIPSKSCGIVTEVLETATVRKSPRQKKVQLRLITFCERGPSME